MGPCSHYSHFLDPRSRTGSPYLGITVSRSLIRPLVRSLVLAGSLPLLFNCGGGGGGSTSGSGSNSQAVPLVTWGGNQAIGSLGTNPTTSPMLFTNHRGQAVLLWISQSALSSTLNASVFANGAWTTSVVIDSDSIVEQTNLDAAIDDAGNACVSWTAILNGKLVPSIRYFDGGTKQWGQNITVGDSSFGAGTSQMFSASTRVCFTSPGQVAIAWRYSYSIIKYNTYSSSGVGLPGIVVDAAPRYSSMSRLTSDDSGRAALAWVESDPATGTSLSANSAIFNGGAWSAGSTLSTADGPGAISLCMDHQGRIMAGWSIYTDTWHGAACLFDGAAWSSPVPHPSTYRLAPYDIAIVSNGNNQFWSAWSQNDTGGSRSVPKISQWTGSGWAQPKSFLSMYALGGIGLGLSADPVSGRLLFAWAEEQSTPTPEYFSLYSPAGGGTWTSAQTVTTLPSDCRVSSIQLAGKDAIFALNLKSVNGAPQIGVIKGQIAMP